MMAGAVHWAEQYIGRAYIPRAFDCWAFFRLVQWERFGRDLPVVSVDSCNRLACAREIRDHDERASWSRVANPQEGDGVLMASNKYPSHVGVWVDTNGGAVLHCVEGAGVVLQRPAQLAAAGWPRLEFYRHV